MYIHTERERERERSFKLFKIVKIPFSNSKYIELA